MQAEKKDRLKRAPSLLTNSRYVSRRERTATSRSRAVTKLVDQCHLQSRDGPALSHVINESLNPKKVQTINQLDKFEDVMTSDRVSNLKSELKETKPSFENATKNFLYNIDPSKRVLKLN